MFVYELTKPNTLVKTEREMPTVKANEVLLKIERLGICGSDPQIYHGLHKNAEMPVVPGHECVATVVEVGSDVKGYSAGDEVTVEPQIFCGECYPCKMGRFNVCEHLHVFGLQEDGFAAQYCAVDAKYLHECNGVELNKAVLIEPLAVGVGAIKRAGNVEGANVVVVGAGTIGNLVAQCAKAFGAAHVMVTDISDIKLDYAKECGIDFCMNTAEKSLDEVIRETFGTRRADVIIDCAATKSSLPSILDAARPRSTVVVTGNYKTSIELFPPVFQRQEITIAGHMMYVREDFRDAIELLRKDAIYTNKFDTVHFKFDQYPEAMEYFCEHSREVMKVVVDFD